MTPPELNYLTLLNCSEPLKARGKKNAVVAGANKGGFGVSSLKRQQMAVLQL